jgi:hypothetical protein
MRTNIRGTTLRSYRVTLLAQRVTVGCFASRSPLTLPLHTPTRAGSVTSQSSSPLMMLLITIGLLHQIHSEPREGRVMLEPNNPFAKLPAVLGRLKAVERILE